MIAFSALVKRHFWLLVVIVMITGLFFRLHGASSRSLWIDELYSEWFASRTFVDLWRDVPQYEPHVPVYYTLLKLWTSVLGETELGLRSLSIVASLATILVIAVSGHVLRHPLSSRAASLLGAALLAVNHANIRDAQNARPYALQTLFCTLAIVAALVLASRLRREAPSAEWRMPAMVLGLSAGVALLLHNTSLFVALGIWGGLALSVVALPPQQRPKGLAIVCGSGLLAVLVWAPFIPLFLAQSKAFMGLAFWLQPKLRDLYSAWFLLLGESWPALTVGLALLAIGVFRLAQRGRFLALVIVTILILPLYTMLAVSFAIKPIFIQRLFDWMVPLGLLVIAVGILEASRLPWPGLVLAPLILALAAAGSIADANRPIDDWKAIVGEIARNAQPGDVVIAVAAEGSIAVDYYAHQQAAFPPVVCVPGCYPQRNLARTYISNLGAPTIVEEDAAIVDRALKSHGRVWLVQVSVALYDPRSIVRSRIARVRTFVRYYGNSLARVDLFQ